MKLTYNKQLAGRLLGTAFVFMALSVPAYNQINKQARAFNGQYCLKPATWSISNKPITKETLKTEAKQETPAAETAEPSSIEPERAAEPKEVDTRAYITEIKRYFPASAVETAYKVMIAESGAIPDAIGNNRNGTRDRGLFQINSIHLKRVEGDLSTLLVPEVNVKVAAELQGEQGWGIWSVCRSHKVNCD